MIRKLAIFPWGDVIEEFLDPLGLSAGDFARKMRGGWLFGYVRALATVGIESVIVYGSEQVLAPERMSHAETGAPIWLVPARRSGAGLTRKNPSLGAVQRWRRTPFRGFARVLRDERCDALLVQDYEQPRFDSLVLMARALSRPVYASFQGGDVTLSPLEAQVRRFTLKQTSAVICPSSRERERLRSQHGFGPERITDVPNPVDTGFWSAEPRRIARAAMGVPHDRFLVVNHGRIDIHRKGLDVLLSAWREVSAEAPDAELVVIGSGQDRAAFGALAAQAPRLRWIDGYVTDPAMIRRWLSAADVYVSLSRIEGMPVAPLEALSCGLPLVASDAHGLIDLFRDGDPGGALAPREDAAAAADAILAFRDRDRRHAAAVRARRTAVERYGFATVGRQLKSVFERPATFGALARGREIHPCPEAACPG